MGMLTLQVVSSEEAGISHSFTPTWEVSVKHSAEQGGSNFTSELQFLFFFEMGIELTVQLRRDHHARCPAMLGNQAQSFMPLM